MNLVVLKGNLSRDIELKHYSWGSVANTAIAVNRKYTDKNGNKMREVSFIELSLFGRIAEIAANFLHKGSPLLVQGRLKQESWQDDYGNNKSRLVVLVESMEMLGGKKEDSSPNNINASTPRQPPEIIIEDENIPF